MTRLYLYKIALWFVDWRWRVAARRSVRAQARVIQWDRRLKAATERVVTQHDVLYHIWTSRRRLSEARAKRAGI